MKKAILSISLFVGSIGLASAGSFGLGGQVDAWSGSTGGYASSATQGGSMANGNVNGSGYSQQFTSNKGAGASYAGAAAGQGEVVTYSGGSSHAANLSKGFTSGQAQGATAGAVGTDFSSEAWGNFDTVSFGASIGFSGFGDFGGGQGNNNNCNGNSCGNHGWGDHSNGNGNGHNNGNH